MSASRDAPDASPEEGLAPAPKDPAGTAIDGSAPAVEGAQAAVIDEIDEEEGAEAPRAVPDHARTVVVPLANPDTAPELLALARAVVRGEEGRVIALVVVLGEADAEANLDRVEAVEEIVGTVRARDGRVEMEVLTRPAPSVARGILDVTRDEGADMVILGVQAPTPGGVAIGGVAEQVIEAAQCDVLIYRRGRHGRGLSDVTGVVIGVDASDDARVAARLGIIIGQGLGQPVEALHVRRPDDTDVQAAAVLARALDGLDGAEHSERRITSSATAVAGLRAGIASTKLTVVGFHTVAALGGGRLGRTTRGALDTLRGPVLAISRPDRLEGSAKVLHRLTTLLRPRLTEAEEQSLIWHARLASTLTTDFVVLCVISSVLATLGLLLNSAAVIIGAMLVAPLMSPLVGFGTALVDGDLRTLRRSAVTTGIGSALVAGAAVLIGLVVRPDAPTAEMLSRGSPSLIDAGVAAASGIVGGYASARKGIPAALAGVAIAAALVPPICVFGLAVTSDARLAAGAGLLFLTNISLIAAASAVVLLWLGVRVVGGDVARRRYLRLIAPVLAIVLGALVLFGLTSTGPDVRAVERVVEEELPDAEVVAVDEAGPSGTITVTVRTASVPAGPAVARAADRVEEITGGLELRLAVQSVLLGS